MNTIVINVGLTMFWLFLGGYLLVYESIHGTPLRWRLPFGGINPGYLAILFAAFNLYRVYSVWSYRRRRQAQLDEDEEMRRQWEKRHQESRPKEPLNPDFMFDQPPRTESEPPRAN